MRHLMLVVLVCIGLTGCSQLTFNKGYNSDICWNRGGGGEDTYMWRNGCRGSKPSDGQMCTMAFVNMTSDEVRQYKAWEKAGSPILDGCE